MLNPIAQFLIGAAISAAVAVTVTPAARSQPLDPKTASPDTWVVEVPVVGAGHTSPSAFLRPFKDEDECSEFLAGDEWAAVFEDFTGYELLAHEGKVAIGTPRCTQIGKIRAYGVGQPT